MCIRDRADVRIGLGGVAHKPWRARVAEEVLRGGPATAQAYRAAIDAELEPARPGGDNADKVLQLQRAVPAVLSALAATERAEAGR